MVETAEKLLGRSLVNNDGINIKNIEEAEYILETNLPKYLREFYLNIGGLKLFTQSFERFFYVDELYFRDNKLIFLEENQNVCIWGININEDNPIVYQNADNEWYSEEIRLSEFIKIMMYYQCAQGYENAKNIILDKIELAKIIIGMEKVVDNNHLIIFWGNNVLLWYYTDDENKIINNSIIISGLTDGKLNEFINKNNIKI